jgi:hypothetical protein
MTPGLGDVQGFEYHFWRDITTTMAAMAWAGWRGLKMTIQLILFITSHYSVLLQIFVFCNAVQKKRTNSIFVCTPPPAFLFFFFATLIHTHVHISSHQRGDNDTTCN